MRRMKVLVMPGWYPTRDNPISGIYFKETNEAISLYNDVSVLFIEGRDNSIRTPFTIEEDDDEGVRVLRVRYKQSPIPKTTKVIYYFMLLSAYRRLILGGFVPDIIHAHLYFAGYDALFLGKLFRKPVIISEHQSRFTRGLIVGKELSKARSAFRRAQLVCPVSIGLQNVIEEDYNIKARFKVVPNVVNTEIFKPHGIDHSGQLIHMLFVGGLDGAHKKGFPILLTALSEINKTRKNWILDVVGSGPMLAEYKQMAAQLGISERVTFHGGDKPKTEISEFMNKSDFFLLPSLFETFGIVLIEAMACGKPVIATNVDGPRDIVNDRLGLLVRPGDAKELEHAIAYMMDHFASYDSRYISDYISSLYSYSAIGGKWNQIYQKISQQWTRNQEETIG